MRNCGRISVLVTALQRPPALRLNRSQSVPNTSIRTVYFASSLSHETADALNAESGRIYSQVLVEQYRIYRKKGIWLSPKAQERYNDYLNCETPKLLHA